MISMAQIVLLLIGLISFLGFTGAALVSFRENEMRAARRFFLLGMISAVIFPGTVLIEYPGREFIAGFLVGLSLTLIAAIILPLRFRRKYKYSKPTGRIDERDIMFSRRRLQPGSQRFEDYYAAQPDKREVDDLFRANPGLMAPGSSFYDPVQFAAAEASFDTVEAFWDLVDGRVADKKQEISAGQISLFIKNWAKKLGAVSVGITAIRDYHYYSHRGRQEPYGEVITEFHKYGIALTVEMSKEMLDLAPQGPTLMESAQQYLEAGRIAAQLAVFIRKLGYPARAHIDGNYEVVCPLVARDAGLGEIGRMGLLMTPNLGPRVRIAVVTTDMPLIAYEAAGDTSMIDFCSICKKCADACPGQAISFSDRQDIDGVKRWQINQEACYTFWCQSGTDCGRCVAVCPYSHADNLMHNLVRKGIKHSGIFARLAKSLDDFFYGRIPAPKKNPNWLTISKNNKQA